MTLRLVIHDTPGTGLAYDVSELAGDLFKIAEQIEATGTPDTLDITLVSSRAGYTLPVTPTAGQHLVLADDAGFPGAPDPHDYKFVGKIGTCPVTERVYGLDYLCKCISPMHELNTYAPRLEFNGTDHPDDQARVNALFDGTLITLPNTWDGTTHVGGPYVTYTAGTRTPYRGKVADILTQLANDPGETLTTPVAPRRWWVTAAWLDPTDYDLGVQRAVHYAATDFIEVETVPLTDNPAGTADYAWDSFDRANNNASLGQSDSAHTWTALRGTWGVVSNYAYLGAGHASGNNAAVTLAGISDGALRATVRVLQDDTGLAARVTTHGTHGWQGFGFGPKAASSRYELRKYAGGSWTLLATVALNPQVNDILTLTLSGTTLTPAVTRSGVTTTGTPATDALNSATTTHGLYAQNASTTARWDDWGMQGVGAWYAGGWEYIPDAAALANILPIEGPDAEPLPVKWDDATLTGVETQEGLIQKTTTTEAWDAGGNSLQTLGAEGGEVVWSVETLVLGSDTFERQDNPALIGELLTGQDWQRAPGTYTWGITGGTAYASALGAASGVVYAEFGAANVILEMTVSTNVAGAVRLVGRVTDENNYLFLEASSGGYTLKKRVAGVDTTIGALVGPAPANGHVLKLSMEGNTLNTYVNGAAVHSGVSESAHNTVTKHGFGLTSGGGAARIADYRVRQSYAHKFLGLDSAEGAHSYTDGEFGILFNINRTYVVSEGGVAKTVAAAYTTGDWFKIEIKLWVTTTPRYEVRYWRLAAGAVHWSLLYTSLTYPDLHLTPYHVDVALYTAGAAFNNITLEKYSAELFYDQDSIDLFGPWPAGDVVKDASLDTQAKRYAYALAYFAERAGLRKSYAHRTLTRYTPGKRVKYNNSKLGISNRLVYLPQVRVDRSTMNRTTWWYELTLDAPLGLFGVRRRGALVGGPDGVRTPGRPLNLAAGACVPDSTNSRAVQTVTWTVPTSNEQWIEFWPQTAVGQAGPETVDQYPRFPAGAGSADLDLALLTTYMLQARYVPMSGAAGPWCSPIELTTCGPEIPAAPTNVNVTQTGLQKAGYGGAPMGWTKGTFTPSTYRSISHYEYSLVSPQGRTVWRRDDILAADATTFDFGNLPLGTYDLYLRTVGGGNAGTGPDSVVETFTLAVGVGEGPSSFEFTDVTKAAPDTALPVGWSELSSANVATSGRSTSVVYVGKASLTESIANGAGSTVTVHCDPVHVQAGMLYEWWVAVKGDNTNGLWTAAVAFYTSSDTLVGVPTTLDSDPPSTTWTEYKGNFTAPTNAIYYRIRLTYAYGGTLGSGKLYYALQPLRWRPLVQTQSIDDLAVISSKIGAGAVIAGKLADGAVDTAGRLASGIVTDAKFASAVKTNPTWVAWDIETNPLRLYDDSGNYKGTLQYNGAADQFRVSAINASGATGLVLEGGSSSRLYLGDSGDIAELAGSTGLTVGGPIVAASTYNGLNFRGGGTSNPGSPAAGDVFFRTDLRQWIEYDGSHWVGEKVFLPLHNYRGSPPYSATEEALACGIVSDHALKVIRIAAGVYIGGTNNATNYWTLRLRRLSAGISVDTVGDITTAAVSPNTWTQLQITSGFTNNPLNATDIWAQCYIFTTLSPAQLYFTYLVECRKVVP